MDEANNGDSAARPLAGPQGSYMYQAQPSESAGPGMYAAANAYAQQHFAQNHVLQEQLKKFWGEMMEDVQGVGTDPAEFKSQQLPLARVKKIMKSDEDVRMISAEAPVLFAKACEFFILEMTLRAWNAAEEHKRRTLQRSDIATAISRTVVWDFLLDTVPLEGESAVPPAPTSGPGIPSSLGLATAETGATQPQVTAPIAAMPGVPGSSLNVYHQGQPFFQPMSGPLPPPPSQGPLPPQGTQYRQPGLVAPGGMSMPGLMYPPPGLFFPQQAPHPPGYGQTMMGGAVAMPSGTVQMPGPYPTGIPPTNVPEAQTDAGTEKANTQSNS